MTTEQKIIGPILITVFLIAVISRGRKLPKDIKDMDTEAKVGVSIIVFAGIWFLIDLWGTF